MFFQKAVFCRVFQAAFRMALPVLPYREPEIIGSCLELDKVFKKEKISSVLIVTDKGIVGNGLVKTLEEVLQASGVFYTIYDNTYAKGIAQITDLDRDSQLCGIDATHFRNLWEKCP